MGVGGAVGGVGLEGGGERVLGVGFGTGEGVRVGIDSVSIEKVEKDANVFQTGVHALPIERHHSVRGIAEDDDRGGVVVRRAFYGYEW